MDWLRDKIIANDSKAIESFIWANQKSLRQIDFLETGTPIKTELGQHGIFLNLNLLQLAAFVGNEDTLRFVLGMYMFATGESLKELIIKKGSNEFCNGFNLLHLAAMNKEHKATSEFIISTCPAAANALSVNNKLPLDIAYDTANTSLIRNLMDATSPANLEKIQRNAGRAALQRILVNMSKDKERYFAARKRLEELMARLKRISEQSILELYENNGQWLLLPDDKERCNRYRQQLVTLYDKENLTTEDLHSPFVLEAKSYIEKNEKEITEAGQAQLYKQHIEHILYRLAEKLWVGSDMDIDAIARALKEYGYKGDLTFLTNEILSKDATKSQALTALHQLIVFYNNTIPMLEDILTKVRIPVYEGESSREVMRKAFSVYYQFQSLHDLFKELEPNMTYPRSTFGNLITMMGSIDKLTVRVDELIDFFKQITEINKKYQRINCDYRCLQMRIPNLVQTKLEDINYVDAFTRAAIYKRESEFARFEEMAKKYPDAMRSLNLYAKACMRDREADYVTLAKRAALQVLNFKNIDDARFFLEEINRVYDENFPNHPNSHEHILTFMSVIQHVLTLAPQLTADVDMTKSNFVVKRIEITDQVGIHLEIHITKDGYSVASHGLEKLTDRELKKLRGRLQSHLNETSKITQEKQQSLQDEIQKLTNLVELIKKLSGDPVHYTPIVDAIEKIGQVQKKIEAAEAAVTRVKEEIVVVKREIIATLDKQEILIQKLRQINQLEDQLVKTSHKAVIDLFEKNLAARRESLQKPLSLQEFTSIKAECEDSLSTTSSFHDDVFAAYSHDKITELKTLVQDIQKLVADYVDDARQLCAPQYKAVEDFQSEVHALPGLQPNSPSYKKAITDLDKRLSNKISAAQKQKEVYEKSIASVKKLQTQLADAVAQLNTQLTKFKELQQGLIYPAASSHIFSEIDLEIDNLVATTKISYVADADEEVQDNSKDDQLETQPNQPSSKIPQVKSTPITAVSLEDITKLPERYQQLTKQLSGLSTKITTKTQEARQAEDKAKDQSSKQESKALTEAKKALEEKIKKLIDLQQRIAITGVDGTLAVFKDNLAIISAVTGDQNNICTIKSTVDLLNPLTKTDQVTGLEMKVDLAIQEAEKALTTAIRIQLTSMVGSYNDKMTKLYEELKAPLTAPSTDCQKTAKKFTALIKQPEFQKNCSSDPIEQVVSELSHQPQKTLASNWRNITKAHNDAKQAIENETTLAQTEFKNYENTIRSLRGLIDRFKQIHTLYNDILSDCAQDLAGLQAVSLKYTSERTKFITLLCESADHPAAITLSLAKVDALFKEKGLIGLELREKDANRHLKNLLTYKNQASEYQTTTTNTKKDEHLKLRNTLSTLKTNLKEWEAKKHLPLDDPKLQALIKNCDELLTAKQAADQSYLSFLNAEITKLRNLEGRIKEFIADAKQVEIAYQQRTSKIYNALPALKTAITNFHNLARYATKNEEVRVKDANDLIAKMYDYFSREILKPVVNPDNNILGQIEKDIKDLQDLLIPLNKKLGENKDQKELDEKDRLNKAEKDMQEKLANLEDLSKRLVFLNSKLEVSRLPHLLMEQIRSLQQSKVARNISAFTVASQQIDDLIEQQLKPAIEQAFKQYIVELSNNYQIAVEKFDTVKNKAEAKAVVEDCEKLDTEFTQKVAALGLCVDAFPTRDAFSALSTALFVLGTATEMDSAQFKKAVSSLPYLVQNHKVAILGKITTFNNAQNQNTNSAQEDYAKALAKLESLQARYRSIQTLSPDANKDWEKNTSKVIDDAKTKPKNNAEDYRTSTTSIEDEIKLLESEITPSLATIIIDTLKPYNDAIQNLTEDERKNSQLPQAVKDLYGLLRLEPPKRLAQIKVVQPAAIIKLNDEQFDSFIEKFSNYVSNAKHAVDDVKQENALQKNLASLQALAKNLLFLNSKFVFSDLSSHLPAALKQIRSLHELSNFKIAKIIASLGDGEEALSSANQAINDFIEQQLKPATEQAFQQLLTELSNNYKLAVDQFNTVKDKPEAKEVVEDCEKLDVEFTQKVAVLGLCADAFPARVAFTALSPALFVLGRATEMDSAQFKKAVSSLQTLVQNHKVAILGKISTYSNAKNQNTNSAQEDYAKALAKLESLQARYRSIQTLSPDANKDWEQRTNKVIEDAKIKPKNNGEDYRTATASIEDEIKLLESEITPSLATIIIDTLTPYNDAIQNLTEDERKNSQLPQAVKDLYGLLRLEAPKRLAQIKVVQPAAIMKLNDEQIDSFIEKFSSYVSNAKHAVDDVKQENALQKNLANLQALAKNLLFLNSKFDFMDLSNHLPAALKGIRSLQELSNFKIAKIIASLSDGEEALSSANQAVKDFIEQQLKPATERAFQQLLTELSNDYKIAVDKFDTIKNKPEAKEVVEDCEKLDVEFTQKVAALGLCVDAFQKRKPLSALSSVLFESARATEMNPVQFKKAVSSLQSLVQKHKVALIEEITEFNNAQNKKTDEAKADYEKALAKLVGLQVRYRGIQTLIPNPNKAWEPCTDEVIEQAKAKPKNNAQDYRTAIASVEAEIQLLKSEVLPSLTTIITDILKPYNDAIQNLTEDERKNSQVPQAVKTLYELLQLEVPKRLAQITVQANAITNFNDEQFNSFITNFSKYVGEAERALKAQKQDQTKKPSTIPSKPKPSSVGQRSGIDYESPYLEAVRTYFTDLERKIEAQSEFNPDISKRFNKIIPQFQKFISTLNEDEIALSDDNNIQRYVEGFDKVFKRWIVDCKEDAQTESFSFGRLGRFFSVLFGWGNKPKIDGHEIVIEHSNTARFLADLEDNHHSKMTNLASQRQSRHPGQLIIEENGMSHTRMSQTFEEAKSPAHVDVKPVSSDSNEKSKGTRSKNKKADSNVSEAQGYLLTKEQLDFAIKVHHWGGSKRPEDPVPPQQQVDVIEALRKTTKHEAELEQQQQQTTTAAHKKTNGTKRS